MAKNNMTDSAPPPNPGDSITMASSSDIHIKEKINMHLAIFTPSAVYFTTNMDKQETLTTTSSVPTPQAGQFVTHIDSNIYRVP